MSNTRSDRLAPAGIPRWLRIYDSGPDGAIDRYTVVFTGRFAKNSCPQQGKEYPYLAMNGAPFWPQGFCQHGGTFNQPCDTLGKEPGYYWPPALGRKNHLGKRIPFKALPGDCQIAVWQDYANIWDLKMPARYRRPAVHALA